MAAAYDDELLCTLACIRDAEQIVHEDDGTLLVRVNEIEYVPLEDAHLNRLVELGWLELVDLAGGDFNLCMNVTGAGSYHLGRWEAGLRKRRAELRRWNRRG